jgi:hypothetical protein
MKKTSSTLNLAAASALGLGLLSGDSAQLQVPSPEAIATEQYTCSITEVTDKKQDLLKDSRTSRGAVVISLALNDRPKVTEYTKIYPTGGANGMDWLSPNGAVFADVSRQNRATTSHIRVNTPTDVNFHDSTSPTGDDHDPEFTIYPRADHPNGREADVYIETPVTTGIDPIVRTVGYTLCGTIQKQEGAWVIAPTSLQAEQKFIVQRALESN